MTHALAQTGATLGDLERLLEEHGIAASEVKGLRIVPFRRGDPDSPLWLEIKRYVTNREGSRFAVRWPTNRNWVVAYETLRIPIAELSVADEPAIRHDPKVTYEDDHGVVHHRRASTIVREQMENPPSRLSFR